jgi:hypothetical protein
MFSVKQAAAHVMDVVGVAVVGEADGHRRLERRRCELRDLQPVESAPGNADHSDRARAPGLARDPVDHLHPVVEFGLGILVLHEAVRVAVAADIDTHAGIAVARQPGMGEFVALQRSVPAPVGQVFQYRRNRPRRRHRRGSQIRAASRVPSRISIQTGSRTRHGSFASVLLATTALADTTATAVTDLNLRAGPGPMHEVVSVIPEGASVTVDACIEASNWCQVRHDGTDGWAFADYLQTELAAAPEPLVLSAPEARTEIRIIEEHETGARTGAGGAAGAIVGAILGGPPGALLGAAAGLSAGAMIEPSDRVVTYVRENPVETVYLDGEVVVGAGLPEAVTLQPVPESDLTYAYVNTVPVLVEPQERRIVYIHR